MRRISNKEVLEDFGIEEGTINSVTFKWLKDVHSHFTNGQRRIFLGEEEREYVRNLVLGRKKGGKTKNELSK